MKFTASVPTFTHSHRILNKGRNVNFGGTGDFLEVQGEGAFLHPSSVHPYSLPLFSFSSLHRLIHVLRLCFLLPNHHSPLFFPSFSHLHTHKKQRHQICKIRAIRNRNLQKSEQTKVSIPKN